MGVNESDFCIRVCVLTVKHSQRIGRISLGRTNYKLSEEALLMAIRARG